MAGASPYYSVAAGAAALSASNLSSGCNGKLYKIVVANSAGATLSSGSGTLTVTLGNANLALTTAVNLTQAGQVTVVIYG